MRSYEMMAILNPDLETEVHESSLKKIEKLIADNSGQLKSVDNWGKKRLAYEIKHVKEGNYSIFHFQGTAATVKEVDRVLKIDDNVVRFMIVKVPEKS